VEKQKAAVIVANSNGAVQCMGVRENAELERQEGQTDSAGKERVNAVGMGSGPSMQGRQVHWWEETPAQGNLYRPLRREHPPRERKHQRGRPSGAHMHDRLQRMLRLGHFMYAFKFLQGSGYVRVIFRLNQGSLAHNVRNAMVRTRPIGHSCKQARRSVVSVPS
jgi:hypothetical protein